MIQPENQNKREQRYAEITACQVLVDPSKSRRLRDMLKGRSADYQEKKADSEDIIEKTHEAVPALQKELLLARRIIDNEIHNIMSFYPEGMKNSLFKIRFGHLDQVRAMAVSDIFRLLKLECKQVDLKRLQGMNYHGQRIN